MAMDGLRLLLVLPFGAGAKHGGAAIFRALLQDWPHERLIWHDVLGRSGSQGGPGTGSATPWQFGVLQASRLRPVRTRLAGLADRLEPRLMVPSIVAACRSASPDLMLFYGHTAMLHIYERLLDKVSIPFHLTVHDCPLIHLDMPSGSAFHKTPARERFRSLYAAATSRDVISERMRRSYRSRFGADAVVITKGIRRDALPATARTITAPVNIVMGGGGFRTELWPGDADPLDAFVEAIAGQPDLRMHLFDQTYAYQQDNVTTVPWMDQAAYDAFLASMHIGYAYDMLTPVGRRFAAMSFPTKIVNYVCQGMPFLYHGPADSTVGDFVADFPCGVVCDSLDAHDLRIAVRSIIANYDDMQEACRQAASRCFDLERICSRFRGVLGSGIEIRDPTSAVRSVAG